MRTWCVVSQKGGSGKTTLLLHVSVVALKKGLAVSILDLDPQRSAEQWGELREELIGAEEPTVVHGTPQRLDGMLEAARETKTDLALIDTPPAVDKSMIFAAAAADVVIVPTRCSVLDRFALQETLDYLKRIGAQPKTVVVLNAPTTDKAARAEVEKVAMGFGVAVLDATIDNEADLSSALGKGKGVTESAPRRKSARQVQELFEELMAFDRKLAKARGRVTA